MKKILVRSLSGIGLLAIGTFLVLQFVRPQAFNSEEKVQRFERNLVDVKSFLQKHPSYNQKVVFMVDMRIPSNYNRFFVYEVSKNKISHKGLVAHGKGSNTRVKDSLQFSNIEGSNMTSLGNYKVGASYIGRFGKSYKLHGLDKTNDQAFARYVVLHTYPLMPHEEQLLPVMRSEGCPMVSEQMFQILEGIIDTSEKPILLRIYYR